MALLGARPVTWLRMLSLSVLITNSLASDFAPAASLATLGAATAVTAAFQTTNVANSATAVVAKTDSIPTSILSTVIVTIKDTATPTSLTHQSKPAIESPAIAVPALAPTPAPLIAAQESDSPQTNVNFPFDPEPSSSDAETPSSTPRLFPLQGGHGPMVPSSNSALIFTFADAPLTTGPASSIQTIFITTGGNGAASTVTSYINTAAMPSPGLAGDRDSSAMTMSLPKSTKFSTVTNSAARSYTTVTAAGSSTSAAPNATNKPALIKNTGTRVSGTPWAATVGLLGAGMLFVLYI